ncbi:MULTISPECIES: LysR family transcriptional regulator [unclassified Colwellia]|jgi:DNA-binding transcriptional LysR family regulator|uniref:LysR family transcriptional regulator n=1 Tax=unclassified Colwellia TaxID=196834 RepID=UPI0015F41987|nr:MULTISPECIES: LysR family transcriptional regulator [unclassified Colwellia]MBA6365343.1 LysR family transcriptional regulator [Colwellia sp. BRX8-8]MBA6376995.1 LysR family transcriptional regulator [Colwellia sp. BRX8-2]MBA6337485.1 LysR family transcriptional regulator [Colwellia sp. BRX8-7]MBA6348026.1 LysR family transcriptional regulator [Colwellia sp. BRX8-9]MBA6352958.1 LysR family transcriptional regulator [Colwellia sp. BRX9-1]|tara:strand:+ start:1049 stop:1930 length:882 start_codon:yes stop_codon:yes gene_type:complete
MNLKRLAYFCQLALLGNFTRAAHKIGIAQPALSIAIQKLEQEVGLKLINRTDKNSLLTAEGEVLYKLATQLLSQAKQVELELEELKDLERGTIRFGVSAMMGSYYFPKVLTAFKQKYPKIKIHLIDQGTAALEKMLMNGELDLALIRGDLENQQLRYTELIDEEIVAAMAISHPLAKEETLSLAQFCQEPLVLFHQGYFLREVVSHYAKAHNLSLDIRMETNLIELQKSLVRNEVGITTCLSRILQNEQQITSIPFEPKLAFKLSLAWKKDHYLSKASKAFMTCLTSTLDPIN